MTSTIAAFRNALLAATLATASLAATAHAGAAVSAGDRQAPPGFIVEFGSIGTGINGALLDALLTELQAELASGNLRQYSLETYGREGERRVCFVMAERGSAWELVRRLQASGLSDDRVGYSGTASCPTAVNAKRKPSR